MGFRKKCRVCGHQMSLHEGAEASTPQPAVEMNDSSTPESSPEPVVHDTRLPASVQPSAVSVVDELTKLAALRRDDMITQAQFDALRDQLLNAQTLPAGPDATPTSATTTRATPAERRLMTCKACGDKATVSGRGAYVCRCGAVVEMRP